MIDQRERRPVSGGRAGSVRLGRHLLAVALAVVAAGGLLTLPARAPDVRAATPDLTIVTDATYEVQPEQHRVRVTVDMVLANHLRDTATRRYYYDHAFMAVLPDASNYRLSWSGGGKPGVAVSKKNAKYTVLDLKLAARIYSGKSAKYRLVFDLLDKGGTATRDVRIGTALASFPVWAFATDSTPGSTVRVVFPAGFETEVQAGEIPEPTTDAAGRVVFQTGPLAKPIDFFAYLVGDRAGAYVEQTATATMGGASVRVTIRGWPDDKAWSDRVASLVERGLPVLSTKIGLPWQRNPWLVIQEAVGRSTGGYAGLFDPTEGHVDIAYFADDPVVLHESAHAWFNGSLVADRWASEAFASYYGFEAAKDLKVQGKEDVLTPELEAARIPLNAWGPVGRETTATEDYAYAASLTLARAIAERAGDDALKAVWADASARVGAYQPPPTARIPAGRPETVDDPPDWRGLLDLLEAHTNASFEDLWRTWVTRPSDEPLLDARRAARARYDQVVAKAADWRLPRTVRDAMRAWRFDDATALLGDAASILDERTAIEDAATRSGLTSPGTLRSAFEGNGFAAAAKEAAAERDAIAHYDAAVATRLPAPDVFETLGLWDTTPDAQLAAARDAFAAGDLARSVDAAGAAAATWSSAAELGRGRAISIGAGALAVLFALGLLIALARGLRRRRRAAAAGALAAEAAAIDAAGSGAGLVPGDVAAAGWAAVDGSGVATGWAAVDGSGVAISPTSGDGSGEAMGRTPGGAPAQAILASGDGAAADAVPTLDDGSAQANGGPSGDGPAAAMDAVSVDASGQPIGRASSEGPAMDGGPAPADLPAPAVPPMPSDAEATVAGDVLAPPGTAAAPVDATEPTRPLEGDAAVDAGAPNDAPAPQTNTTPASVDTPVSAGVPDAATAADQPTERVPVTDAYATLAATSPVPEAQPGDEAQTGA